VSAPGLVLPRGKRVSVAILDGGRKGEVIALPRPRIVIGRAGGGAQLDIALPDPQVSRVHALLECYGLRVVLRDLDSTNGTFVDGRRIIEANIDNQGEFRVGQTACLLIIADK
jgi:S-DNA-T family DNA segregation ATPase FtsK/SpoIIIE